jgi:AcrR family transcriptional regulator
MTRSYNSPLREDQTQRTHRLIVDALIERLSDSGHSEFSFGDVAERAGVSVRTVHRHFPKREDLLEAVDERFHEAGPPRPPADPAELPESMAQLWDWFESNSELVEAMHLTSLGRELRQHGRERRARDTRKLIDAWAPELTEPERKRSWAAMRVMFGSVAWRTMRHELCLTSEETSDTFAWMLELVLNDLERRRKHAQRKGERDD